MTPQGRRVGVAVHLKAAAGQIPQQQGAHRPIVFHHRHTRAGARHGGGLGARFRVGAMAVPDAFPNMA
ncbi:hypothetical protein GCM10023339_52630 [Alloalcanivorax gelatiniphagus]